MNNGEKRKQEGRQDGGTDEQRDTVAGYYMNKGHWSTVCLDGAVPKQVLADMVQAAHKTLPASLSKKAQREILGG